jgi:hypothetical protein
MAGQTGTLAGFWDEIITYLLRGDKQRTITALAGKIAARQYCGIMIAVSVTFLSIAFFGLDAATNIYAVSAWYFLLQPELDPPGRYSLPALPVVRNPKVSPHWRHFYSLLAH